MNEKEILLKKISDSIKSMATNKLIRPKTLNKWYRPNEQTNTKNKRK